MFGKQSQRYIQNRIADRDRFILDFKFQWVVLDDLDLQGVLHHPPPKNELMR